MKVEEEGSCTIPLSKASLHAFQPGQDQTLSGIESSRSSLSSSSREKWQAVATAKESQVKFLVSSDDFPCGFPCFHDGFSFKNGLGAEEGNFFCILDHVLTSNQQVLANCYRGSSSE